MSDGFDDDGERRQWVVGDWLDGPALATLQEINAQCLDLLCAVPPGSRRHGIADGLRAELTALPPDARRKLAACPYLLVDAGFADEARWLPDHRLPDDAAATPFDGEAGRAFRRRVLTFGWYLARSHRQLARLVLGLTPTCAQRIAALQLDRLDAIADQHPGWVRLRWDGAPRIWRPLIAAARDADAAALERLSLRGLQLLASAALPPGVR